MHTNAHYAFDVAAVFVAAGTLGFAPRRPKHDGLNNFNSRSRFYAARHRPPSPVTICPSTAAALALESEGLAVLARAEIVDACLVRVTTLVDGLPVPNHFYERFKIIGRL